MAEPTDADAALDAALGKMDAGYREAVEIAAAIDGYDGYRAATRISNALAAKTEEPARLRARRAAEIAEQESLSLRGLAKRISVSTTRAKYLRDTANVGGDDAE